MKTKSKSPAFGQPVTAFPELYEPISKERPCGDDLEYDPEFVVLQAKAATKPDAQYGEFVSTPEAVNWSDLERDCRRLLLRTRDIRVLVLLLRCRVRLDGASGLRDGLAVLAQLLAKWPEAIYPQLVVDGEIDPALRANALAALADPQGLMQDVRELAITSTGALRLQMRDVERSFGIPRPADALAPESVQQQLQDLRQQQSPALMALDQAAAFAASIDAWARQHLSDDHPDLGPLLKLLGFVAEAIPRAATLVPVEPVRAASTDVSSTGGVNLDRADPPIDALHKASLSGTLPDAHMDRDAVRATIRSAQLWFEHNEPSSPVSLLLKQAERLTGKRFDEVFQAIPADLVERWAQND
ncbi:ImpA family type VI secretion system protein [Ralstonia psammae]